MTQNPITWKIHDIVAAPASVKIAVALLPDWQCSHWCRSGKDGRRLWPGGELVPDWPVETTCRGRERDVTASGSEWQAGGDRVGELHRAHRRTHACLKRMSPSP